MQNNPLNNYFGFNKQQRNGIYVLCVLSFFILLLRLVYPYFLPVEKIEVANIELAENELDSQLVVREKLHQNHNNRYTLFAFDPNTVSKEELLKLGFWERTANTFLKYRSKGAVFRKKEDLKKVYGISEKFYTALEPYIIIQSSAQHTSGNFNNKPKIKAVLELNSADSISLIDLKGVGPGYARRILKYRSMLGGFNNIEQLREVYGMSDELFELIKQQCAVNPDLIKKLNINTADFKTVNKHPYIGYELTKQFFNFRKNGAIKVQDLQLIVQDENTVQKLLPYLEF